MDTSPNASQPASYESVVQSIAHRIEQSIPKRWAPSETRRARTFLRKHRKDLRRFARAAATGNLRKARDAARPILESFPGRFLAALRAHRKRWTYFCYHDVVRLAQATCMYREPREPIDTWSEPKSDGGVRWLCAFRVQRQAQQILLDDLLRVLLWDGPDYALSGGTHAAVRHVIDQQDAANHAFYVRGDIKDFFGSIAHQGLETVMPFPRRVTRAVLTPRMPGNPPEENSLRNEGEETGKGSRGIPQGSIASNAVGAYVLKSVHCHVAPGGGVVLYRDDMMCGAEDATTARQIGRKLGRVLRKHPCGPFHLDPVVRSCEKGIKFLGYYLRAMPDRWGGDPRARASYDAWDRMRERLANIIASYETLAEREYYGWKYFREWLASFREWPISAREKEYLMCSVQCVIADVDRIMSLLPPGSGPVTWRWDNVQDRICIQTKSS